MNFSKNTITRGARAFSFISNIAWILNKSRWWFNKVRRKLTKRNKSLSLWRLLLLSPCPSLSQVKPLYFVQLTEKVLLIQNYLILSAKLSYLEGNILEDTNSDFFDQKISLWHNYKFYPLLYVCILMKSKIAMLILMAIYSWILIFTIGY